MILSTTRNLAQHTVVQRCDQVSDRESLWRVLGVEGMPGEHGEQDASTAREQTCSTVKLDGRPPCLQQRRIRLGCRRPALARDLSAGGDVRLPLFTNLLQAPRRGPDRSTLGESYVQHAWSIVRY
jgi:hypothetical protein